MDKIDFAAIIDKNWPYTSKPSTEIVKACMKEAIRQALVLAIENAELVEINEPEYTVTVLNKQSILDIEKRITNE